MGAPFGFHLTRFCYYFHTQQHFPELSVLGFGFSFLNSVFDQRFKVIGRSVGVIYTLGRMDNSFESIESITALDEILSLPILLTQLNHRPLLGRVILSACRMQPKAFFLLCRGLN